jgi:hypothetical protein
MVKMDRLCYFGHLLRMDDTRLAKQLFFAELDVEKHRPVGRPRMTWNDCVLNDLEDFGISTKAELLTHDGWLRVKAITLDRDEWRRTLKTDGLEYALNKWYVDQTNRRSANMIRLGVDREYCVESEEPIDADYDRSKRTPLECVPHTEVRKILRKVGGPRAEELMNEVKRVEEKRKRPMNEYEAWTLPYITTRVHEHADDKEAYLLKVERWKAIRLKKIKREVLFLEWLPTSNVYDDPDEGFSVEAYDRFREKGVDGAKRDQFHVMWHPRIFAADEDFPVELPEKEGLAWAESDLDWMDVNTVMNRYKKYKDENEELLINLGLLKSGKIGCVVVEGAVE